MFSDLDGTQKYLVYKTLLHAIRTNSGIGFANNDQGHPVYRMGADGKSFGGDSPADNVMFHLVKALYTECGAEDPDIDLSTWQGFCQFAIRSYDEKADRRTS